jgi:glycerophosphoryl diester phosphodiesterase
VPLLFDRVARQDGVEHPVTEYCLACGMAPCERRNIEIMKFYVLLTAISVLAPTPAQTQRVVAISHRGEHLERPENTLPAFKEAIRVEADFIEVDVQTTKDGKLVLSHDGTVDRCTNGTGKVSDMTFDQVEALDAGIKKGPQFAGTKVPTLDEVLDLARGKIGVYVDIRNASAQDLVSHINGHCSASSAIGWRKRTTLEVAMSVFF